MSKARIAILGVALVSAVGAGILAKGFLSRSNIQPESVQVVEKVESEEVLVIVKDVLMGDKLGEGVIAWQEWPKTQVQPAMITKTAKPNALDEYKDARSRYAMFQGEVIVDKKIVLPGERGFMSAILPKGMRAISVAVSERTSAGGFILPNDRVDVILTKKVPDPQNKSEQMVKSDTVLSNVRVLAINQTYRQEKEGESATVAEGKTATLELTLEQSEAMARIESSGELSLALRSIAESDGRTLAEEKPQLAQAYSKDAKAEVPSAREVKFIKAGVPSVAGGKTN